MTENRIVNETVERAKAREAIGKKVTASKMRSDAYYEEYNKQYNEYVNKAKAEEDAKKDAEQVTAKRIILGETPKTNYVEDDDAIKAKQKQEEESARKRKESDDLATQRTQAAVKAKDPHKVENAVFDKIQDVAVPENGISAHSIAGNVISDQINPVAKYVPAVAKFLYNIFAPVDEESIKANGDTSKPVERSAGDVINAVTKTVVGGDFSKTTLQNTNSYKDITAKKIGPQDSSTRHSTLTNMFRDFGIGQISTQMTRYKGYIDSKNEELDQLNKLEAYDDYSKLIDKSILHGDNSLTDVEKANKDRYSKEIDSFKMYGVLDKYPKSKEERESKKKELQSEVADYNKEYKNLEVELYNHEKPDAWYSSRKANTSMDKLSALYSPDSYIYQLPNMMGASNSDPKLAVAQNTLMLGASVLSKMAGSYGKVGAGLIYGGIAASNIALNVLSRDQESASNVGDEVTKEFKTKVKGAMELDLDKPAQAKMFTDLYRRKYQNLKDYSDEEVINYLQLHYTDDPVLEKLKEESRVGANVLYSKNNKQSVLDIAETAVLIPGIGASYKYISKAAAIPFLKLGKYSYEGLSALSATNKVANLTKKAIDATYAVGKFSKATLNAPQAYLMARELTAGSNVASKAYKYGAGTLSYFNTMGKTMLMEGVLEEGGQAVMASDFHQGKYKDEVDNSFAKDTYDSYAASVHSAAVYSGLVKDPILTATNDFVTQINGGFILTIVQGGAQHVVSKGTEAIVQKVENMYNKHKETVIKNNLTEMFEANDRFTKDKVYASKYMNGNPEQIAAAFANIREGQKNVKTAIPGLTEEMIKDEENRAKTVSELVESKAAQRVKKILNADDYSIYVALLARAIDQSDEKIKNSNAANTTHEGNVLNIAKSAQATLQKYGLHINPLRDITDADRTLTDDVIAEIEAKHEVSIKKDENGNYVAIGAKGKRNGVSSTARAANAMSEINPLIESKVKEASATGETINEDVIAKYTRASLLLQALDKTIEALTNTPGNHKEHLSELTKRRKEVSDVHGQIKNILNKHKNVTDIVDDYVTDKDVTDAIIKLRTAKETELSSTHMMQMLAVQEGVAKKGKPSIKDRAALHTEDETLNETRTSSIEYIHNILNKYKTSEIEDNTDTNRLINEHEGLPTVEDPSPFGEEGPVEGEYMSVEELEAKRKEEINNLPFFVEHRQYIENPDNYVSPGVDYATKYNDNPRQTLLEEVGWYKEYLKTGEWASGRKVDAEDIDALNAWIIEGEEALRQIDEINAKYAEIVKQQKEKKPIIAEEEAVVAPAADTATAITTTAPAVNTPTSNPEQTIVDNVILHILGVANRDTKKNINITDKDVRQAINNGKISNLVNKLKVKFRLTDNVKATEVANRLIDEFIPKKPGEIIVEIPKVVEPEPKIGVEDYVPVIAGKPEDFTVFDTDEVSSDLAKMEADMGGYIQVYTFELSPEMQAEADAYYAEKNNDQTQAEPETETNAEGVVDLARQDLAEQVEPFEEPVAQEVILTEDELDDIKLKEYYTHVKSLGMNMNAFINPEVIIPLSKIGAIYMKRGIRRFQPWATLIIKELGESTTHHLKYIYNLVVDSLEDQTGTDTEVQVAGIDVKALVKAVLSGNIDDARIALDIANKPAEEVQVYSMVKSGELTDPYSHTLFYQHLTTTPMTIIDNNHHEGRKEYKPLSGKDLSDASSLKDFVSASTFHFAFDDERWHSAYIIIEYNGTNAKYKGKTFAAAIRSEKTLRASLKDSNLSVEEINNIVKELNSFRNSIYSLREESRRTGKRIVPISNQGEVGKVSRTNGKFKLNIVDGKIKFRAPQEVVGLQLGSDMSKLSQTMHKIGFGGGFNSRFEIKTNKGTVLSGGQSGGTYLFIQPSSLNVQTIENVPISLNSRKFSHSDQYGSIEEQDKLLDFIVDLIVFKGENTNLLNNGLASIVKFDKLKLLNFIINFGDHTVAATNSDGTLRTNKILTLTTDGNIIYGNNTKSLSSLRNSVSELAAFKNHIKDNFTWSSDADHYLGENGLLNLGDVLPELAAFFTNNQTVNNVVLIPNVLEFSREDVANPTVAWLFKHGKLLTSIHDDLFENSFMFAKGAQLETADMKPMREAKQNTPVIETKPVVKEEVKIDEAPKAETTPEKPVAKRTRPTVVQKKDDKLAKTLLGDKDYLGPNSVARPIVSETTAEFEKEEVMRLLGLSPEEVEIHEAVALSLSNGIHIFGKMMEDVIVLANTLERGTGYHEAFHRVSLLLLTPEKRNALYNDFRRVNKLSSAISNKQIEEFMAEDFREFMLTDIPNTKFYNLIKYYRKASRFIETALGISNNTKQRIYKDIQYGVYAKQKINKTSLEEFRLSYATAPELRQDNGVDTMTIKNVGELNDIVNSLTAITIMQNGITSLESLGDNIDFALTKAEILRISQEPESELQADKFELFDELIEGNNFEEIFIPMIKNRLRDIQIDIVEGDDALMASMEDGNHLMSWDIASNEVNPLHGMLKDIKLLIATIPISKLENGKIVLSTSSLTDLPLLYNFKNSWSKLIRTLHSSNSAEDMMQRISKMALADDSKESSFFRVVYNRINAQLSNLIDTDGNPISKEVRENYLTQFFITLKKHNAKYIQLEFSNEGKSSFHRNIFNLSFPNTKTQINKVTRQWFKNFSNIEALWNTTKYNREVDKDKIKVVVDKFQNLVANAKELDLNPVTVDNKQEAYAILADLKFDFINILNSIGISDITEEIIDAIIMDRWTNNPNFGKGSKITAFYEYLTQPVPVKGGRAKPSVSDFMFYLNSKTQSYDHKLFANAAIIELAAAVSSEKQTGTLSTLGPKGNMYFNIVENNTITDIINDIATGAKVLVEGISTDIKQALNNTTFITGTNGRGSMFMNFLNDNKNARFEVVTYINYLQKRKADAGKDFFELSPAEDMLLKMAYTQHDYMPFSTLADKKTFGAIGAKGFKLFHNIFNLEKNEDGKVVYTLDDKVYMTFLNYLKAEFDCIVNLENSIATESSHVDNFDVNGKLFRNFNLPVTLRDGTETTFNAILNKAYKEGNAEKGFEILRELFFKEYELTDKSTSDEIEEYNKLVDFRKSVIQAALKKQIDVDYAKAVELKIISPQTDKNGKIIIGAPMNTEMDADLVDAYTLTFNKLRVNKLNPRDLAIYEILAQFSVNSIVSNIEFQKIVSKDPAYYKNKADEGKRLGGFNSTGSNGREDFPADHWINGDENTCTNGQYNVVELIDSKIRSSYVERLHQSFYDNYVKDYTEQYAAKKFSSEEQRAAEIHKAAEAAAKLQLAPYKSINTTDATVLISPMMYKNILMRFEGAWTKEVEEAFKLLETSDAYLYDKDAYNKSLAVILKPLKYVYVGDEFRNDGTRVPIYNKMAMFPVFKAIATTGDMARIYESMTSTESPIHMYKFQSATKIGGKKKVEVYKDGDITDMNDMNSIDKSLIYKEGFHYLRKQLVTDPHDVDRTLTGTQVIKAALANINPKNIYNNILIAGKNATGRELIEEVMSSINALTTLGIKRVKSKYNITTDGETITIDEKTLSKILIKDAIASNMSSDLIQSFKIVDGKFKIPLNTLSEAKWIEQKFISYINKEVIDIRMPGNAFIQKSTFAFQTLDIQDKLDVMSDVEINGLNTSEYVLNNGKRLEFRRENGSTEAVISINLFNPIIPSYIKSLSFIEQRAWLYANNLIGHNAEPSALGYRVPTQGQSSIDSLTIMDVFPATVGDTIMLPDEFTKKNGSDFDVDKLFIARYNYKISKTDVRPVNQAELDDIRREYAKYKQDNEITTNDQKIIDKFLRQYDKTIVWNNETKQFTRIAFTAEKIKFDDTLGNATKSKWEANAERKDGREALENRMIEVYTALLTSDHHVHETRASIDTVSESLNGEGGVLETIEGLLKYSPESNPLYGVSATYNLNKKLENAISKNGIGPFALNIVHHVLTQLASCQVTNFIANKPLYRISSISGRIGEDNVRILDWLSAMINAHVDAAKDPYITRLNVVPLTYALTNFLLRTGKGESTFYFMKQPIITKLIAYLDTNPTTNLEEAATAILKELNIPAETKLKSNIPYLFDKKVLMTQLEDSVKTLNGTELAQYLVNQKEILDSFLELNRLALEMSEWVGVSQVDTKKFGNTLTHIRRYIYKYNKFKYDATPRDKHTPVFSNVLEMFNNSFIEHKTKNALELIQKLFAKHLLSGSDEFIDLENRIFSDIGKLKNANDKLINSVYFGISGLIKSNHFNNSFGGSYNDLVKPLLFGTNTLANRLYSIKNDISLGLYPDLLDDDGKISNTFLASLFSNKRQLDQDANRPDLITVDLSKDFGASSQFRMGWNDLLNSNDEALRSFAEDMVIYAFYNTADNPGANKIFHLVPQQKRIELGYDKLDISMKSIALSVNQIYKNMWKDDQLVPTVYSRNIESSHNIGIEVGDKVLSTVIDGYSSAMNIPQVMALNKRYSTGINSSGKPVFVPYVKMKFDGPENYNGTMLYRFVGVKYDGEIVTPIYALSDKKGFYDNKDGAFFTEFTNEPSMFPSNKINTMDKKFATIGEVDNSSIFDRPEFKKVLGDTFVYYDMFDRMVYDNGIFDSQLGSDFEHDIDFDRQDIQYTIQDNQDGTSIHTFIIGNTKYNYIFDANNNIIDSTDFNTVQEAIEFYNKNIKPDVAEVKDATRTYTVEETTPRQLQQANPINIYAGTGDNIELSNFANRPFTVIEEDVNEDSSTADISDRKFNTVEGAFHAQKLVTAWYTDKLSDEYVEDILNKLEIATGSNARSIGRSIPMFKEAVAKWDSISANALKILMKQSFEQNPEELQKLLATGNAELTHKFNGIEQDKGRFSKLLMEVRDELRNQKPTTLNDLENSAIAVIRSTKGDDKYIFLTSQKDMFGDTIEADDKNGSRVKGSNYHGIDIISDYYTSKEIMDKTGKDTVDILFVDSIEEAQQQFDNYISGGAKQFSNIEMKNNTVQSETTISEQTLNEINKKHSTSYTMEEYNALPEGQKKIAINCK